MSASIRPEEVVDSPERSAHANRQIQLGPRTSAALVALALAHLSAGASDKALVVARGLLQLAPGEPKFAMLLGVCLFAEKRLDEARALLDRVQASPECGGQQVGLSARMLGAALHWEQGHREESAREFRGYLSAAQICCPTPKASGH